MEAIVKILNNANLSDKEVVEELLKAEVRVNEKSKIRIHLKYPIDISKTEQGIEFIKYIDTIVDYAIKDIFFDDSDDLQVKILRQIKDKFKEICQPKFDKINLK